MPFWVTALLFVGSTVISALLRPKAPTRPRSDLSEFDAPTISENRGLPVLFGRRWLRGPNWAWYGDVSIEVIFEKGPRKFGLFGKRQKIPVGEKWFAGGHLVFAHRLDRLIELRAGEVDEPIWTGSLSANTTLQIDKPELFGGDKKGGGIVGPVAVMFGAITQQPNAYLDGKTSSEGIAYRDELSLVLEHVYLGTSRTVEPWMALGETLSTETGWYPLKAAVGAGGDMNPAHIIYDALTSAKWARMNVPVSLIDDASFRAAADTLFNEGFGLSIEFGNNGMSARQFIFDIVRHIDGNVFEDPATGLWRLTLNRLDFDFQTLLVLDKTNSTVLRAGIRSPEATGVVVVYDDRDLRRERATASDSDLAAVELLGGEIIVEERFPGISNATLATQVAARERSQRTRELIECDLDAHDVAQDLVPGSVFRWQPAKLEGTVVPTGGIAMRVMRADKGTLDRRNIRINAIQVLISESSTFAPPPTTGWVDPIQAPTASTQRLAMESPYQMLIADQLGPEATASMTVDQGVSLIAAVAPTGGALDLEVWTRVGAAAFALEEPNGQFAAVAVLSAAVGPADTALTVTAAGALVGFVVGELAALRSGTVVELVRVDAIAGSTVTVARGLVDTVPAPHAAGAELFAVIQAVFLDDARTAAEVLDVRVLPATAAGRLALTSAPTDSITFARRAARPYPPAGLLINGASYPASAAGQVRVTAVTRNRLTQAGTLVAQSAAQVVHEPGTTYTVRWLLNTVAVRTQTGLPTPEDVFTPAANGTLRIEIEAVRDGLTSWQALSHEVAYTLAGGTTQTVIGGLPLTAETGVAYSAQAIVTGLSGTITWTRVGTGTPANLVNVTTSGLVTFTQPTPVTVTFTLQADNGVDPVVQRAFSVVVADPAGAVGFDELGGTPADNPALQQALDDKAAAVHVHALADLLQSGATDGQVPAWNETAGVWVPATPSGGAAPLVIEDVTTTTYTYVAVDAGKAKRFTNAAGCATTAPSAVLPDDAQVFLLRDTAGPVTVTAGAGATLVIPTDQTASLLGPPAWAVLTYETASRAVLTGELVPASPPGTVTSVAVANATGITWTGSPITTEGTLTPTLSTNLQAWSGIAPATKANDADVVKITGDQEIAGVKTFRDRPHFQPSTAINYVVEFGQTVGGANVITALDFHTGATVAPDYDSRLQFTGGNGVNGGGTLNLQLASFFLNGIEILTATSPRFFSKHPSGLVNIFNTDMGVVNNSISPGFYANTVDSVSGAPTTNRQHFLHSRRDAGGGEVQLSVDEVTANIFSRGRVTGAWSVWRQSWDSINTPLVSQAEAESGTGTANRVWTPQRVKQAINALQFPPTEIVSGATYTVVAADAGKVKKLTNAGAVAITLSNGVLTADQIVYFQNAATGAVTFVNGGTMVITQTAGDQKQMAAAPSFAAIRADSATAATLFGGLEPTP